MVKKSKKIVSKITSKIENNNNKNIIVKKRFPNDSIAGEKGIILFELSIAKEKDKIYNVLLENGLTINLNENDTYLCDNGFLPGSVGGLQAPTN